MWRRSTPRAMIRSYFRSGSSSSGGRACSRCTRRRSAICPTSTSGFTADCGHQSDREHAAGASLAALMILRTLRAQTKFEFGEADAQETGYSMRGMATLAAWVLKRLQLTMGDLSKLERRQLARTSPHSLGHRFGTQAVASGMPLDVVRQLLGHGSLSEVGRTETFCRGDFAFGCRSRESAAMTVRDARRAGARQAG